MNVVNVKTGEIVSTQKELIEAWKEANKAKKQAEDAIKQCKIVAVSMNIELNKPIFNDYGLIIKKRIIKEYDKSKLKLILDNDEIELFTIIDKTPFKKWVKNERAELQKEIEETLYEKSRSEFLQLKAF